MQSSIGDDPAPVAGGLGRDNRGVSSVPAGPRGRGWRLFATRDRRLGRCGPWARFLRARDGLHAALAVQIRERRAAPGLEQRSDVLSTLLLARDQQGQGMSDEEVRDELVTLLLAGHETTATSLAWAFDLLLHHPPALGRLVAELDGGGAEYLDAVIMEALRVRPVVAIVDRQVRQATQIGDHTPLPSS